MIAGLMLMASCSESNENNLPTPQNSQYLISATFEEIAAGDSDDDFSATRSHLTWNNTDNTVKFEWSGSKQGEVPDAIAVFSDAEKDLAEQKYTLRTFNEGENKAYFESGGFQLMKNKMYYAFTPYQNIDDKRHITVDYSGQRQMTNDDCSHLGAYDFMAACGIPDENRYVNFKFKHLGTVLRVRVNFANILTNENPSLSLTKFQMTTGDNYEFQYKRTLDLTDDNADLADYAPALSLHHSPSTGGGGTNSFDLDLGWGADGITVNRESPILTMYLMVPASNELLGKQMFGILTETRGNKYYISWDGQIYPTTETRRVAKYVSTSENLNISLTVDKRWQHGNTVKQTRGATTGDPGNEDILDEPDHIYIYTCVDGKYRSLTEVKKGDTGWKGWKDSGNKWSYNGNIVINPGAPSATDNIHTYIIVSKGEVTRSVTTTLVSNTTLESVVSAMLLRSTFSSEFLKNIYAYDYGISFNSTPIINAIVYHIAAKLDIQWNAKTALSGNVKVNNLPTNDIPFFNPVATQGTGTYAPTLALNPGTSYNGRAVFYVPQMETPTYNITIGSSTQDVEFTPNIGSKWTSWLKANVTLP